MFRMEPPRDFVAPGEVKEAKFAWPSWKKPQRYEGIRAVGVKYERKAQRELMASLGQDYIASPWIYFRGSLGWRWCQPDGLLIDVARGLITIVEIKLTHTTRAWWQCRKLYEPVLRAMFPLHLWRICVVEVVRYFDPATWFPEHVKLTPRVDAGYADFGVHIL
jgi:hypothetical protein